MHCLHCEVQAAYLADLLGPSFVCQAGPKAVHIWGQDMLFAHKEFCQHLQLPGLASQSVRLPADWPASPCKRPGWCQIVYSCLDGCRSSIATGTQPSSMCLGSSLGASSLQPWCSHYTALVSLAASLTPACSSGWGSRHPTTLSGGSAWPQSILELLILPLPW